MKNKIDFWIKTLSVILISMVSLLIVLSKPIIVLNGGDYLICDDVIIDNINYLYVISLDGKKYSLLKREISEGTDTVESVQDKKTIKKVLEIIGVEENI